MYPRLGKITPPHLNKTQTIKHKLDGVPQTESIIWKLIGEDVRCAVFPHNSPRYSICTAHVHVQCVCAHFSSPDVAQLSPVSLVLQRDAYSRKL